ncbi:hypothetical protein GCM10027586_13190 [Kineococcus gypseus]|uniref:hypothetical protein n=1 Tax=Kineococcus gypseus TaxID=1637102 RepID=UPI003D7C7758
MPKPLRTWSMSRTDCLQRAATAREHLAVARERLEVANAEPGPSEMAQVAASNAVLAAIAAADAVCGSTLGECSGEQDHRTATALLRRVQGADELVAKLQRLLADKTALQYGGYCTDAVARASVSRAEALVRALDQHGL